jgi:hypothetical protein
LVAPRLVAFASGEASVVVNFGAEDELVAVVNSLLLFHGLSKSSERHMSLPSAAAASNDLERRLSARAVFEAGEVKRVPLAERERDPGVPGWLPWGEPFGEEPEPNPSKEKSSARSSSGSCKRCSELDDLSAGLHSWASSAKLSNDDRPSSSASWRTVEVDPVSEPTGLVALLAMSERVSLDVPRGGSFEYRKGSTCDADSPPPDLADGGESVAPGTAGSFGPLDSVGDGGAPRLAALGDGSFGENFDNTGDDGFFGFSDEPESDGGNGGRSRSLVVDFFLPLTDESPELDVMEGACRS